MGIFDIFKRKTPVIRAASYVGASTDRLLADFKASLGSADSIIAESLVTLRARSRDMERNNEYVAHYLRLMRVNVIGAQGIRLQVKARNPDQSMDLAGSQMVEDAWADFSQLGNPTVDGQWSVFDMLNHVATALPRDGEVIVQKVRSDKVPRGIALQFIEPDLLDEAMTEDARNGNKIVMGVELDRSTRRPVAYHFLRSHPGDNNFNSIASKHVRVPAAEVIHVFQRDRVGQTRGVPWAASSIRSLKMLHGYREAELVAARVGASKIGFFTSKSGDGFSADRYETDSAGQNAAPIMNAEPGSFHQLPADVELSSWDPSHPNSGYADFEKAILRGVASGLGPSYPTLSNDTSGVNYSTLRQLAIVERDFYKTIQQFVISHFMHPVFAWWLDHAMDFGVLPFNGPIKYRKFLSGSKWNPRGFAWVDPEKEMRASVIGLQNGLTTHSDVAASQGRDVDDLFSQIERDSEAAKRYGLELNYQPFGDVTPPPPDPTQGSNN